MNIFNKKKHVFPSVNLISLLLLLFILIVIGIYSFLYFKDKQIKHIETTNEQKYVDLLINKCKDTFDHTVCYAKESPVLIAHESLQTSFQIISLLQEQDKNFRYCHTAAHVLGELEVRKDPSHWTNVLKECPNTMCQNGCLHGAIQEKYKKAILSNEDIDGLNESLLDTCETTDNWHPTKLEIRNCYHALGHALVYATTADLSKTLSLCEALTINKNDSISKKDSCYHGAFMSVFQPFGSEETALMKALKPVPSAMKNFCDSYSENTHSICYQEGVALYYTVSKPLPFLDITNICEQFSPSYKNDCYNTFIKGNVIFANFDTSYIKSFCNNFKGTLLNNCFSITADIMIQTDVKNMSEAIKVCNDSHDPSFSCFNFLINRSVDAFHKNTPAFYKFCESMPKSLENKCLTTQRIS